MAETPHTPSSTPDARQGTQLARDALGVSEPIAHLAHACTEGEFPLRKLAGFIAGMVTQADCLDRKAEQLHCELARAVHYGDGTGIRHLALNLEEVCTARDRTADFLRRLLICYRAAARLDTQ